MKKRLSLSAKRSVSGMLFISPFVIGFVVLYVLAFGMAVVYSFHDLRIAADGYELLDAGWKHYINAMTNNTWYTRELVNSFQHMLLRVPLIIVFSFFAGCLLNQKFRGRTLARAVFFLPVIMTAGIIAAIDNPDLANETVLHAGAQSGTMTEQLNDAFDITNLLTSFGLPTNITGMLSGVVNQIYEIITDSGVQILVILAALQSISPSLMEAAQIEGATGWECFWKITFPMLSPYILTNTVYSMIDYFGASDNGVLQVINNVAMSGQMDLSYGMAMAMIYFVLTGLFVGLVVLLLSKTVYYEEGR